MCSQVTVIDVFRAPQRSLAKGGGEIEAGKGLSPTAHFHPLTTGDLTMLRCHVNDWWWRGSGSTTTLCSRMTSCGGDASSGGGGGSGLATIIPAAH